jgi:hypothetical protein
MMRLRLFLCLSLLAVLLAACAPAATSVAPAQPAAAEPSATPVLDPAEGTTPAVDLTATYMLELQSATPPVDALPAATSRGPDLHATDPTTVSLASGGLQLVEFFRFT